MKCQSCNAEGGEGKFCSKCGKPMPISSAAGCPACGAEVRPGAKFCLKCGAPQTAAGVAPAAGEQCAKCGGPLTPGVRFCRACGTARDAAPGQTVVTSAAAVSAPTPPKPVAQPPAPEPEKVSYVSPPAKPAVEPVARAGTASMKIVAPVAGPDEPQPGGGNKAPLIAILLVVLIIAGGGAWWFMAHSTPAKAPIEKGPLYSVPAGQ